MSEDTACLDFIVASREGSFFLSMKIFLQFLVLGFARGRLFFL